VPTLPLSPDDLLSTTRAVRRRLDLTRPVGREVIEECLLLALQAPTASNRQDWHFVVVTDRDLREGLAELYRRGAGSYFAGRDLAGKPLLASAYHLVEHLAEVPVLLVPCITGRTEESSTEAQASRWGSIVPATWSFMLAARARGLGTCWTTFHLAHERDAAALLGIPYDEMMQVALIPVAYTVGTDFRPGPRRPLADVVHWDRW
jgi:nitroreductase